MFRKNGIDQHLETTAKRVLIGEHELINHEF